MRRIDNSYRWVIVDIEKKVIPNTDSSEYLELHISDVLVIRELNKKLQQQIKAFKNETAENRNLLITQPEPAIKEFCIKNIESDNNCQLSLIYLEVDNIEQFKATHTDDECHRITYVIEDTILKAEELQRKGFYALPVRPPTVPDGTSRIRFSLTADITEHEIDQLIKLINE